MAFFIFHEYVASSLNPGTLLAAMRKVFVILLVPIVANFISDIIYSFVVMMLILL